MNFIWGVLGILIVLFLVLWGGLIRIHYLKSTIKSPAKRLLLAILTGFLEIF